jgi:thiol-disulfide isomerase/thioredoxin
MKNKVIISFLALVVVGIGAVYFIQSNKVATESDDNKTSSSNSEVAAPANSNAGVYTYYSEETLAAANGTKVLFFHAPWCPQCRQLDAEINDGGIPENTTILKVDYDSNQALRQKYGVTIQTTFVTVDENGNLIKKYVSYEKPTLDNVISNLGL